MLPGKNARLQLIQNVQPLECPVRAGHQRFPDLEERKSLPLQQKYPMPLLCHQGRCRTARRPPSGNDHIVRVILNAMLLIHLSVLPPNFPSSVSRWSLNRLALSSKRGNCTVRHHLHGRPNAQNMPDLFWLLRSQPGQGRPRSPPTGSPVHPGHPVDRRLRRTLRLLGKRRTRVLNRTGINIHTTDDQHIVDPSDNPTFKTPERAAAFTGCPQQLHPISGAIPDNRHAEPVPDWSSPVPLLLQGRRLQDRPPRR